MIPIERLVNQRHRVTAATAENDRADRNPFAFFNVGIESRIIAHRRGEPTVWMRGFFLGIGRPIVPAPVNGMLRRRAIFSFPPNVVVISERDIGIKRVVLDRFHRVRIRFVTRAGNYAEITVLGIHSEQTPVANFHPRDVIADGRHFPAIEVRGRNQHCEIGFAAGAGERGSDVMFSSFGRFNAENQHVLRHPALLTREIRANAQRETFLA